MGSKRVKLRIHPTSFCEEDLIVNIDVLSRDKLQLSVGDVVKILPCVENGTTPQPGLFLKIVNVPQELQSKGGPLSVSREIAGAFGLEGAREVWLRRAGLDEVTLDLVELRIKDQCLTRSDMWRFTSSLADKFVHAGKKLEHASMRVTASRLWSNGTMVSSGAILSSTRVVFRSASVQLFLYLQISAEMWHFDQSGDLYFDKAVGGFLRELFEHWQKEGCNHEVTLLFCWRAFYSKSTLEELSDEVKSSVRTDKKGRNYEDFYKVVAGGESLSDWSSKLVNIKRAFAGLKDSLIKTRGKGVELSRAPEGNVLEAINLAMNVFQRHYADCSFSMTGHQVIIVTAGAGMFEVDHELTRLTNERIINGGVATDLVCLTDQPLHAVPLLKFQDAHDNADYYHIPHWINYSFYSPSHSKIRYRFQPRLQLSDHLINTYLNRGQCRNKGDKLFNPFAVQRSLEDSRKAFQDRLLYRVDYDEYDATVFSLTSGQGVKMQLSQSGQQLSSRRRRTRYHSMGESRPQQSPIKDVDNDPFDNSGSIEGSIETIQVSKEAQLNSSLDTISCRARLLSEEPADLSFKSGRGLLAGSAESLHHFNPVDVTTRRNKPLINPFNPTLTHTDLTAYHRRWMHVFPRDKSGVAFQVHHVIEEESYDQSHDQIKTRISPKSSSESIKTEASREDTGLSSSSGIWMKKINLNDPKQSPALKWRGKIGVGDSPQIGQHDKGSPWLHTQGFDLPSKLPSENFSSARRQGADWRSLTEPACLPITTDYFPSKEKLTNEFVEYNSTMLASCHAYRGEEASGEKSTPAWITDHQDVSTFQVFSEMISQRISQGFQLVFEPSGSQKGSPDTIFSLHQALTQLHEKVTNNKKSGQLLQDVVVKLSLGRVFQRLQLNYPNLMVTTYRRRNSSQEAQTLSLTHTYQLSVAPPTSGDKDVCTQESEFTTKRAGFCHTHAEDYNWNYLDQHICGFSDFDELGESQKYWRCRYLLLPTADHYEGAAVSLIANFARFIEFLNHIKRGVAKCRFGSKQSSQGSFTRQNSLPVSIGSVGRVSTSSLTSDPHATLHSPRPPSRQRLSNIREDRLHPQSPHPADGLKADSRPTSPYLATSHPKSESRKTGVNQTNSGVNPSSDVPSESSKGRKVHRRTSSQDFDSRSIRENDVRSKVNSPQLLRRRGSELKGRGSKPVSPTHKEREKRASEGQRLVDGDVTLPNPAEDSVCSEYSTGASQESFYQVGLLNSSSPPQLIANAMMSSEEGVEFLCQLPGLRNCCFVAMEAVSWVMDKLSGVESRREAVAIMQSLKNEELVIHASGDPHIPFIDGYFLYQLPLKERLERVEQKNKEGLDKSFVLVEPMDYEKFTKRWFEVKVHYPATTTEDQSTLLTVGASPSSESSFPTSFKRSGADYYMNFVGREDHKIPSSMLNRFVEMNPDPQSRSDRPEWCYVRYDHAYRPQAAFQLELQWMVATMNLLRQLIQGWVSKATMCGFSLVPAPMLSSLTADSHPLTQQHFIPLSLPPSFPDWATDATPLFRLLSTLLTRFRFLLDPASLPQCSDLLSPNYDSGDFTSRLFVHQSGVAFVQPYCDVTDSNKGALSDDQETAGMEIEGSSLREPSRRISVPIGSSTPVMGSPSNGLYISVSDRVGGQSRCGLYWHRNHLLLRQNKASGVVEEYCELLNKLTRFCKDEDGSLSELCDMIDHDRE